MTNEGISHSAQVIWKALLDSERAYFRARQNFILRVPDKLSIVRKSLHIPSERSTALRLFPFLKAEERLQLFDELLYLASVGHADISLVRETILTLDRNYVINNIELFAKNILENGGHEEYRRLLELYILLDPNITYRLATIASRSTDEDIREAGMDFLDNLVDMGIDINRNGNHK